MATSVSVLLVGPEVQGYPALKVTTELLRIGHLRGVELTALVGPEVNASWVLERLERQRYDVMIWSGHGAPARLLLSDGRAVSPNWLASQLSRHGTRLAVLATCESATRPEQAALSLGFQDVLPKRGVSVVAMSEDVADTAAVEYNVALVQALEAGASLRQAHETGLEAAALEGDARKPQLFVADSMAYQQNLDGIDNQLLRSMSDKMDRVGEQVSDIKTKQAVLEADVRRLVQDVQELRTAIGDLRKGTFAVPRLYIGLVVLMAMVTLVALIGLTWRVL